MRGVFIGVFLLQLILSLIFLLFLPDRVAIHFGAGGLADGWGSKWTGFCLGLGVQVSLFCVFYFMDRIMFWFPVRWVNLPNRTYWLAPERREETREKLSAFMLPFGIAFFLFFMAMNALTFHANLSDPVRLDMRFFWACFILFLAYTVYWCVRLCLEWRIPDQDKTKEKTG